MLDAVTSKLSSIPKELIPVLSIGMVIIAVFLIIIFFVLCVLYLNTRPPSVIKKTEKKNPEIKKEPIKIRYEELPIISGRLGEVLSLGGILNVGPITKTFFKVMDILKNSTYKIRWRYKTPFFMIMGPDNSGKKVILDSLGFENISTPFSDVNSMWRIFKKGAIFNLPKIEDNANKDAFWSFLSELFMFIRPKRPLDGIIVTIPVDILLSTTYDLEKHAGELFDRIFKFQKDINFRLPIYIIVTKSDLISGFSEFSYFLDVKVKQQIFGWSNPYTLNTAFSETWIKDIIATVHDGIRKGVLSYALEQQIDENLEKIVLFEENFRKIEEPLSLYLNKMFRSHDPVDGLMLRGVYFIGKHKALFTSTGIIRPNALKPQNFSNTRVDDSIIYNDELCFLQDLFSEKIFRESNLAHPINSDRIDMTKKVFRNKVILVSSAAVITVGWFFGNNRIRTNINSNYKVLNNIKIKLQKIKDFEKNIDESAEARKSLDDQARDLLHHMPQINSFDFFSPFVLQTWFSSLPKNIMETMGYVFDSVIARALYMDLNTNTRNALDKYNEEQEANKETRDLFDINSFSSFRKLKKFVDNISSIKKLSSEYNSIRNLEDRENVVNLTSALFNDKFDIPEGVKSRQPNKRLMPPQFNIEEYSENIETALENLFNDFMNEAFDGLIEKIINNIVEDINKLESASKMANVAYSSQNLAHLYQKTVLFSDIMKNKNFEWAASRRFSPTKEYVDLISTLNTSEFVSEAFMQDILRTIESRFLKFKDRLRKFKTNFTENIISEELNKESEGFEAFQKELQILLNSPFIGVTPSGNFTKIISDDKMLIWDIRRLKELSDLIDKYNEFSGSMPPDIRPQFFDGYKVIARKCFYPTAQAILGNAQIFDDLPLGKSRELLEESYKTQALNIRNATISITKIAKFFDEVCDQDTLKDCGFTDLIISQYFGLLQKIDNLFSQETPYSTGDRLFDSWRGETNPRYLNMNDDAALKKYLTSQFKRIRFLAKDLAAPVVDLLSSPHIIEKIKDPDLIDKWQEIITSVNDYEEKKPGNSLEALETFLSNTLKNISVDSLDEQGDIKAISESKGDFFTSKRSDVAKALLTRADIVVYDKAAERYRSIRRFFNDNLSSNFPFNRDSQSDASLKDIEDFINLYEENSKGLIEVFEKNKTIKHINNQVFEFITSINKVMPLLKAWINHTKNSNIRQPLFTFNFELRPAPNIEAFTSALIEREIRINEVLANEGEDITYFNDNPAKITFSWVENADENPYEENLPANLIVRKNKAIFSYKGKWALFRLIEKHRMNKEAEAPNGVLLEFDVPLIDKSGGNKIVTSKIVMKVTPNVKVGDKASPIPWPVFTNNCPDLHAETQTFGNGT